MGLSRYGFAKAEKLTGRKKIEEFFKKSSSFYLPDFQVLFRFSGNEGGIHQVLISVPKRKCKKAVDRNFLKRRIREAYRLNKHLIQESKSFYIGLIYLSKKILTYREIQDQLIMCFERLGNINSESNE